jgi:hypothetical protein
MSRMYRGESENEFYGRLSPDDHANRTEPDPDEQMERWRDENGERFLPAVGGGGSGEQEPVVGRRGEG